MQWQRVSSVRSSLSWCQTSDSRIGSRHETESSSISKCFTTGVESTRQWDISPLRSMRRSSTWRRRVQRLNYASTLRGKVHVSAFLYHEHYHTSNSVDHLARIRHFARRKAYRKIEKFLHRKTHNLHPVWQWLWDHYTAQIKDCFVLIDWTMWRDGRQVLMAALAHSGRCLPFLAVAYQVRKVLRSHNQAEHAFFSLLGLLRHSNQQMTCINDRGFARISLVKQFAQRNLRFITRVCHNTYFSSPKYKGLLREYQIKEGSLVDLGEGELGKDPKNQARL